MGGRGMGGRCMGLRSVILRRPRINGNASVRSISPRRAIT